MRANLTLTAIKRDSGSPRTVMRKTIQWACPVTPEKGMAIKVDGVHLFIKDVALDPTKSQWELCVSNYKTDGRALDECYYREMDRLIDILTISSWDKSDETKPQ